MDREAAASLNALCRAVLGDAPDRIDTLRIGPDGAFRATHRLDLGGRAVYATRRRDPAVTAKEARILAALAEQGAPVPECLAFEGGWLLQTSVGGERLAQTLNDGGPDEARALLLRAIGSLADVHAAGRAAALADTIPAFAAGEATAQWLLETLTSIGEHCERALPDFDRGRVAARIAEPGTAFIKWDARPANAALGADGIVRWFDWQHANRRHVSDDLVWLLCDEFVPEEVDPAGLLVDAARDWRADRDRAVAMAVAHVGVRLHAILGDRGRLETSWEDCLANDWLGSRTSARRLATRGAAVARLSDATAPLADWFAGLGL